METPRPAGFYLISARISVCFRQEMDVFCKYYNVPKPPFQSDSVLSIYTTRQTHQSIYSDYYNAVVCKRFLFQGGFLYPACANRLVASLICLELFLQSSPLL